MFFPIMNLPDKGGGDTFDMYLKLTASQITV